MDTRFNKRLGDIFITKPRRSEIAPITFNVNERRINTRTFSSPLILIGVFLALILVGALLLSAPFAHHEQGVGRSSFINIYRHLCCDSYWFNHSRYGHLLDSKWSGDYFASYVCGGD